MMLGKGIEMLEMNGKKKKRKIKEVIRKVVKKDWCSKNCYK